MTQTRDESEQTGGPYYPGQAQQACGHYYPDVVRMRDIRVGFGEALRVLNCCICRKDYTILISPRAFSPRETLENLDEFRAKERARLRLKK